MAQFPAHMDRLFFGQQNDLKNRVGVNKCEIQHLTGVEFQYYWPAAFEFSPGEALIIETDLPKVRPYWNVQLNDPYFNCIEFVYRLSSLNGATAKISSDGKFRAIIALEDPGVPNWLDPRWLYGGHDLGPLVRLRQHAPADPQARQASLAARRAPQGYADGHARAARGGTQDPRPRGPAPPTVVTTGLAQPSMSENRETWSL
jgi:hypothetical protein